METIRVTQSLTAMGTWRGCGIDSTRIAVGRAAAVAHKRLALLLVGDPSISASTWRCLAAGLFGCSISAASGIAAAARID
jgi:hypothetical protein